MSASSVEPTLARPSIHHPGATDQRISARGPRSVVEKMVRAAATVQHTTVRDTIWRWMTMSCVEASSWRLPR